MSRNPYVRPVSRTTWYMRNGRYRKYMLREVARSYIPTEVLNLPKQGFSAPINQWLRHGTGGYRDMLVRLGYHDEAVSK